MMVKRRGKGSDVKDFLSLPWSIMSGGVPAIMFMWGGYVAVILLALPIQPYEQATLVIILLYLPPNKVFPSMAIFHRQEVQSKPS